jgi:hypothetical protein
MIIDDRRNLSGPRLGESSMSLGNFGRQTIAAPIAALTLVAGGGIALAASGGADPAPQAAEHRQVAKPSAKPAEGPKADPAEDRAEHPANDASPSPSLTGLCNAYRAGGYASSTKNGRVNPAWSALESAAGGESDVDDYCDETLDSEADDDDDDDLDKSKPDKPGKPDHADNNSRASERSKH